MIGRIHVSALLLASCAASVVWSSNSFSQPADGVRPKTAAATAMPAVPKFPAKPPRETISGKLSLDQAKAAINDFDRDHRTERQFESILRIKTAVAPADLPALLGWCEILPQREFKAGLIQSLLSRWGQNDPVAAIEYVNKRSKTGERESAVQNIVQGWVETDLTAAAEWSQKLPPGGLRVRCLQAVIAAMARENPEVAFKYSQSLGSAAVSRSPRFPNEESGYSQAIFAEWGRKDPTAAIAAAANLPTSSRDQAYSSIVASWANVDPGAAVAWTKTLPEKNSKNVILRSLANALVNSNPEAAARWLSTVAPSELQNELFGRIAVQWAEKITDAQSRPNRLENAARRWLENDETAAITWIKQSSLSQQIKDRLLGNRQ